MPDDKEVLLTALFNSYIIGEPWVDGQIIAACAACQNRRWTHDGITPCMAICARAHIRAAHYNTAVLTLAALRDMAGLEPPTPEAHAVALKKVERLTVATNVTINNLGALRRDMRAGQPGMAALRSQALAIYLRGILNGQDPNPPGASLVLIEGVHHGG